jgi:mannose-6-phosphate isomerase-like protein (cupin superfamily)
MNGLNLIRQIPVSTFSDQRGNLNVCELEQSVPFSVKRIYFISNVPSGQHRGGHGHINLEQVFFCLKGSFKLSVTDGTIGDENILVTPDIAFYVPKKVWRDLTDFSEDGVCLVLASTPFDPDDYVHSYPDFLERSK